MAFELSSLKTMENFLEPNCLQHRKMSLHKIGEMERVHCEGQVFPLMPFSMDVDAPAFQINCVL